jgi:hypothetical protein
MSGGLLNVATHCRKCLARLKLEEMHYLAHDDGTATCNKCESDWMRAIAEWRMSKGNKPMPERP